jgi:hypothetical protein
MKDEDKRLYQVPGAENVYCADKNCFDYIFWAQDHQGFKEHVDYVMRLCRLDPLLIINHERDGRIVIGFRNEPATSYGTISTLEAGFEDRFLGAESESEAVEEESLVKIVEETVH